MCREKGRGLNKSGSKVFIAVVSYRLAVSERTLPVEIPLNPCSAAADCAVPPGETLLEGLVTGHPVCAVTAEVPAAQWLGCLSLHQVFVHTDVMLYTSQRHLEQQLLLSFPATTGGFKPLPPGLLFFWLNPSQNSCPGIKAQLSLVFKESLLNFCETII